jgi:hypothetical protein
MPPTNLSSLVYYLRVRAGANLREVCYAQTSSLFIHFISDEVKKFFNTDTRSAAILSALGSTLQVANFIKLFWRYYAAIAISLTQGGVHKELQFKGSSLVCKY